MRYFKWTLFPNKPLSNLEQTRHRHRSQAALHLESGTASRCSATREELHKTEKISNNSLTKIKINKAKKLSRYFHICKVYSRNLYVRSALLLFFFFNYSAEKKNSEYMYDRLKGKWVDKRIESTKYIM